MESLDIGIYERQRHLGINSPAEISVIGCGGVGAWVAIDLTMAGAGHVNLFDNDNLELHNINRVPFRPSDVGKPKSLILKKFITGIRPNIAVNRYGKVTPITKRLLGGCVIDCTDKLAAQQLIFGECKKRGLLYFRVGYDGHHLTVIDARHPNAPQIEKVWDDESGRDGYTIINSWVVPPQIAAALVTDIICANRRTGPITTTAYDLSQINELMD